MRLFERLPNVDEYGEPILRLYWIRALIGGHDERRPGIELAALSQDGETFIPVSSARDLYNPDIHIEIPKTYEYFVTTGLDPHKQSYAMPDWIQHPLARFEVCGWLRGPLVTAILDAGLKYGIRQNPDAHSGTTLLRIRPWVNDASLPMTDNELYAHLKYDEIARHSDGLTEGDARYDAYANMITVSSRGAGFPSWTSWVRAYTEYLHGYLSPADDKRWSEIFTHHMPYMRKLMLTYADLASVEDREYTDREVERFSLATAAVIALSWHHDIPRRVQDLVAGVVSPMFLVELD